MANYAQTLDHNAQAKTVAAGPAKLSHVEVAHHMTNGSVALERVEPGKMLQHVADCPHCGEAAGHANPAAE